MPRPATATGRGLAEAGEEGGARRPARRRALPAPLLPLPRPGRGRSGSASTPRSCTRAILLFNVTLTLPGFAGLILTIGVAADANVVIFERIKEEVRAGKSVRAAIAPAIRRASTRSSTRTSSPRSRRSSCSPSHRAGEGLRADAADRHRDLAGHRCRGDARDARTARRLPLVRQPALHGRAAAQQTGRWLQIDFMKRRNTWFAISGGIILARRRLARRPRAQPRHRLQGRNAVTFKTPKPTSTARCARMASRDRTPDAVIQGRGDVPKGATRTRPSRSERRRSSREQRHAHGRSQTKLGDERPARRTSRRASAARSRTRRSSRSSSRCC